MISQGAGAGDHPAKSVRAGTGVRCISTGRIALMDSTRCPIRLPPLKPQHFRTGVYAKPFSDSGCQVADRPQAEQGHTKTRTLF
jgi:hypothetical protein